MITLKVHSCNNGHDMSKIGAAYDPKDNTVVIFDGPGTAAGIGYVEIPVKRGYWIHRGLYLECSHCHEGKDREHCGEPAYCEDCGAKMDAYTPDQQDSCYEHTFRDCDKCEHVECKYK